MDRTHPLDSFTKRVGERFVGVPRTRPERISTNGGNIDRAQGAHIRGRRIEAHISVPTVLVRSALARVDDPLDQCFGFSHQSTEGVDIGRPKVAYQPVLVRVLDLLTRKDQYEMFEELSFERLDDRRRERLREVNVRNAGTDRASETLDIEFGHTGNIPRFTPKEP